MECIVVFAVMVSVVAVIIGLAATAQLRSDGWNASFAHVAKRFGGVHHPGGWASRPVAQFHHGQAHAVLQSGTGVWGQRGTQLVLQWPDPEFACDIGTSARVARVAAMRRARLRHVASGDARFDARFMAQASSEPEGRALLTEGVRATLWRLYGFQNAGATLVTFFSGRVSIETPLQIRQHEALEEFVRLGLRLYDQALLTRSVGIEFVEGEPDPEFMPSKEVPNCPVCGESLLIEVVQCLRCQTPHHRECWQYCGACSTYGCGETRYVWPAGQPPAARR